MTDVSMFAAAASVLTCAALATGITLRLLHRRPYAPMLALVVAGMMMQIVTCTLMRARFAVSRAMVLTAIAVALLARDAASRPAGGLRLAPARTLSATAGLSPAPKTAAAASPWP